MTTQTRKKFAPTSNGPSDPAAARPWNLPTVRTPYIYLTEKESALLELLAGNAGKPVGNEEILDRLFAKRSGEKNTLEVHVHNLRRKMRLYPGVRIDTVLNHGYMLSYVEQPLA